MRDLRTRVALALAMPFVACAAPSPVTTTTQDPAARLPNFVIVLADDLGYGDLGCYGGTAIATPNIDALAAGGLRWVDFHSNGAVCSPTRAALLTGRYQQRAGIPGVVFADPRRPQHFHGLQPEERTFGESLAALGYVTALCGKWHLGYEPRFNPVHHGFASFRGYVSGNVDYVSHIDQAGEHDWWHDARETREAGYVTHLITEHAVAFLEQNRDRPFCLYVAHEAPHSPFQGPGDPALRTDGGGSTGNDAREDRAAALGEMIVALDQGVGELVATLGRLGLERDTLVLFLSDNGATPVGDNGPLRGRKATIWEGGHRVPCIARWPGRIAPGSETDVVAMTMDIMPTLLELAGAETDGPALDGTSLVPVLAGGTLPARPLFWWHGRWIAMRDGSWKLIVDARGERPPRLYNLDRDLGESTDLAVAEPERTATMTAAIAHWRRDVTVGAAVQPGRVR